MDGVVVHEVVRSRRTAPGAGVLNATVRARLLPLRRGLGSTTRPPSQGHGAAPWTGETETRRRLRGRGEGDKDRTRLVRATV